MSTEEWFKGETINWAITVTTTTDGVTAADNLDAATAIELQLKRAPGDADPPLVSLDLTSGITRRTQTGTDVGVADIELPADALEELEAGTYYMDVVVLWADGRRKLVVKPRAVLVRDVVNPP